MDIGSGSRYPSNRLSNFAPSKFIFDGVACNSLEGVLQSFKFESVEMQAEVCKLVGKAAKFKGGKKKWFRTQTLYWKGVPIPRKSDEYQVLLNNLYNAVYTQCDGFRRALNASKGMALGHSMGKTDKTKTILTIREFVGRLKHLRDIGLITPTKVETSFFPKKKYDVLFDFDNTLEFEDVQDFAKMLVNRGLKIGICTARPKTPISNVVSHTTNDDIFEVSKKVGIKKHDIYFTEYEDKFTYLKQFDVRVLLDDRLDETRLFKDSDTLAVFYRKSNDWQDKINDELLKWGV